MKWSEWPKTDQQQLALCEILAAANFKNIQLVLIKLIFLVKMMVRGKISRKFQFGGKTGITPT